MSRNDGLVPPCEIPVLVLGVDVLPHYATQKPVPAFSLAFLVR